MNDCPFVLHGFLLTYGACVVMGCCPITSALVLGTAFYFMAG